MPIYVFHCEQCKKDFEDIVKVGTDKMECPVCGSQADKTMDSFLSVSVGLPNGFQKWRK